MRLILKLSTKPGTILPYNYQYQLASWIYNSIEKEFSDKLHKTNGYKFFTFSEILVKNRKNTDKGINLIDGKSIWIISSPWDQFIKEIAKGVLKNGKLKINNVEFNIDKMKINEAPENIELLKTVSPVYVSTRLEGKKVDLYPNDPKFFENLKNNLTKKYISFYNRKPKGTIHFELLNYKPKRIKIKNNFYRCSHMVFKVFGDPELIKFGYDCGFGSRNSMGFGCVEKYDPNNKTAKELKEEIIKCI